MKYSDQFKKITYVDRDSPDFVDGVSPSLSATNLNAQQDGIVSALLASDEIAARVLECESYVDRINVDAYGVFCEVCNEAVFVPADAWIRDDVAMCYTATFEHPSIHTYTDVELVLCDDQKGKFNISNYDPQEGYIILYTPDLISVDFLQFQLIVKEVRQ